MTPARSAPGRPLLWASALFLLCSWAYFLTYSGGLHSTDEMSMLAVAQSLAKLGRPTSNQLIWQTVFPWTSDAFGPDGELYSKKGPVTSFLSLPFYHVALADPEVGAVEAASLLNGFVTAATVALVFLTALELGYARSTALLVALLYGFGSMAWVYAKFLFSEPVAALFLTLAIYLSLRARRASGPSQAFSGFGVGLALGLAVGTRYATAAMLPFFVLYLYLVWRGERRRLAPGLLSLTLGLALMGGLLGWYNALRFGHPLVPGYAGHEVFTAADFWAAFAGLLVSPGRSIFVYSPVLLLGLAALPWFWRRHREETLLLTGLFLGHVALYSFWFQWWGGNAWGPRFLLPALPPLALLAAPALGAFLSQRRTGLRLAVGGLLALSLVVQGIGLGANFNLAPQPDTSYDEAVWSLSRGLMAGHLALISKEQIDTAWIGWRDGLPYLEPLVFGPLGVLALLTALLLRWATRGRSRWMASLGLASLFLLGLGVMYFNVRRLSAEHLESEPEAQSFVAMLRYVEEQQRPGDVMIMNLPLHVALTLNHGRARLPSYGLALSSAAEDPRVPPLLDRLLSRHSRIWFLIEWSAEANPHSTVERWLEERAFKVEKRWFSDAARLALYESGRRDPAARLTATLHFGEALLLAQEPPPQGVALPRFSLRPGEVLAVRLIWLPQRASWERYKVTLQLLDAQGQLVTQIDREPQDGFAPTSSWRPGEAVPDNYGLVVPASLLPGLYRLMVAMYRLDFPLARLPAYGPAGRWEGDAIPLAELQLP